MRISSKGERERGERGGGGGDWKVSEEPTRGFVMINMFSNVWLMEGKVTPNYFFLTHKLGCENVLNQLWAVAMS